MFYDVSFDVISCHSMSFGVIPVTEHELGSNRAESRQSLLFCEFWLNILKNFF